MVEPRRSCSSRPDHPVVTGTEPRETGLPPAATGRNRHPEDPPARCSVCGETYDAVSDHTGGLMVALAENERFDRVCFEPILDGGDSPSAAGGTGEEAGVPTDDPGAHTDDPQPLIRFFHH